MTNKSESSDETIVVPLELNIGFKSGEHVTRTDLVPISIFDGRDNEGIRAYVEGPHVIVEDKNGDFLHQFELGEKMGDPETGAKLRIHKDKWQRVKSVNENTKLSRAASLVHVPSGQHMFAYFNGENVVLENSEGEVVRRYKCRYRDGISSTENGHKKWLPTLHWKKHKDGSDDRHQLTSEPVLEPLSHTKEKGRLLGTPSDERKIREKLQVMISRGELTQVEPSSVSVPEIGEDCPSTRNLVVRSRDEETSESARLGPPEPAATVHSEK